MMIIINFHPTTFNKIFTIWTMRMKNPLLDQFKMALPLEEGYETIRDKEGEFIEMIKWTKKKKGGI